ncbi:hypothetical protein Scep_006628 [Stephania cephalantha]|uniref:Uncharacterized protein n=1 Tax=Stephania cephalantha TaxID=152367 RepID=A0AAP0K8K5_9MAGN
MDEQEFNSLLDVFPIVRSRNYHPDLESLRGCTSHTTENEQLTNWQNEWSDEDKKEAEVRDIDHKDSFWEKLKSAAEGKVGAEEADKFCKAFQSVVKKLVYEELSVEGAASFISLRRAGQF